MILLKVEDGKREANNFYLNSDFTEYAGDSNVTRDIVGKTVSLLSNTKIERSFNNIEEFVLEVKKQNWGEYQPNDYSRCYITTQNNTYGIEDNAQDEHTYWKLLRQDGYIQAYCSNDGKQWSNVGGTLVTEKLISQGFNKRSNRPLVIEDYQLYKRAFVTLLNFPENTIAILQDESGKEIRRKTFDSDLKCEIFLDCCMKGKIVFTDPLNSIVYTSKLLDLQYGDTYILSPYELEIIYQGQVVSNPTMLGSLYESVVIKNISSSSETYKNLTVMTQDKSSDLIQLSLDGSNFSDTLTIAEIKPNQEIPVYIRIYKSIDNHNFQVRDFQFIIE